MCHVSKLEGKMIYGIDIVAGKETMWITPLWRHGALHSQGCPQNESVVPSPWHRTRSLRRTETSILHKRKSLEDDKPGMCSSLAQPVPRLEGRGREFILAHTLDLCNTQSSASEPLRRPAQCDLHSLIWMFHCGLCLSFLYTISQTPPAIADLQVWVFLLLLQVTATNDC